ncbi:hypothetical protein CVS23_01125 [Prochlorococcus marinus str. XMU1401E]|nr:hypothetical protein [Prochlorococcus marinus str. XMU1401E]
MAPLGFQRVEDYNLIQLMQNLVWNQLVACHAWSQCFESVWIQLLKDHFLIKKSFKFFLKCFDLVC